MNVVYIPTPLKREAFQDIGSRLDNKGKVHFRVWAPRVKRVSVEVVKKDGRRMIPMERSERGYYESLVEGVREGDRYFYNFGGNTRFPDPGSRFQPEGVHGPSEVVDCHGFSWEDKNWQGLKLKDFIIYELHTATFTKAGTFDSIIPLLPYLKELGITAIELMPVAQFPGSRNWGYDGVYPFAPQNSYGGPRKLKMLINECHRAGFAVILDVVYNHIGPEGNYLNRFGYYFTDRYRTPWGDAINFDGPYSDEVRHYFITNALYWVTEYHMDALRIDAIHGIFDFSAKHFLAELAEAVYAQAQRLGRDVYVIPESDLNDVRIIGPAEIGGYGLDAQWNDDFHHALHTLITGERNGYYQDFGGINDLVKAHREGFVYSGQYSTYRKRSHGNSSKGRPGWQFIVFSQNHDQVGNRMLGDRLSQTQSLEKLKLAAAVVVLSPFIPLLFMGEEYGEIAPFQYFVDHSDEALIEAVRQGRRAEFDDFQWKGAIPDPQADETFMHAKLNIELRHHGKHKILFAFYKYIIQLRRQIPALGNLKKEDMEVECFEIEKILYVKKWSNSDKIFYICNFGESLVHIHVPIWDCGWKKLMDSSAERWGGSGEVSIPYIGPGKTKVSLHVSPFSTVLYRNLTEI